jgi:hypothetical protein
MRVKSDSNLRNLNDELIIKLLSLAEKTGIWDFAQRNMLQDEDGTIWFIDTELLYKDKFLERSVCTILSDHNLLKINGYNFSYNACKSLINLLNNTYEEERFTSLLLKDMQ